MAIKSLETTDKIKDNVMELIDFRIFKKTSTGKTKEQIFGINVYKVKEVIFKPQHINKVPSSKDCLEGMINLRGAVIPVINLQKKLGYDSDTLNSDYLVITEFNNLICGFMVNEIKKIRRINWENIVAPPPEIKNEYGDLISSITLLDTGEIMLIIDFEKIIGDMEDRKFELEVNLEEVEKPKECKTILCIDDSSMARMMARKTLESVGYTILEAINGVDGLNVLKEKAKLAAEKNESILNYISGIICDIEMPLMNGFTFTKTMKSDPLLSCLPVVLHSSLSKSVMASKGEDVGAMDFLTKFNANNLIEAANKF